MTRLPKLKISWRRGKQYTSPITLGGGGIITGYNSIKILENQLLKLYIYIYIFVVITNNFFNLLVQALVALYIYIYIIYKYPLKLKYERFENTVYSFNDILLPDKTSARTHTHTHTMMQIESVKYISI